MIDGEARVLARVDALDDEAAFPEVAEAIDEVPVHRGVRRADAGHVDPLVHLPLVDGRPGLRAFVTRAALREIFRSRAQIRLAVASGRVVDGKRDHRAACGLDAVKQLLARGPRARRVELVPHRPSQRRVHLFDAGRCGRRQELQRVARPGRARDRQLAVGMERPLAARRAQEDRAGVGRAEQLDARVDLRRVAQTPGSQLDVLIAFPVCAQRRIVVDAARHVRPVAGLHLAVRRFLEVEHAQRVGGARDEVARAVLPLRFERKGGEIRARGEKFEKFPACGEIGARHGW